MSEKELIITLLTKCSDLEKENESLKLIRSVYLSTLECHVETIEALQRQLAEAREENEKLTNKNILLAEGNSILMQQLKEKQK
jgi:hypothetical protein